MYRGNLTKNLFKSIEGVIKSIIIDKLNENEIFISIEMIDKLDYETGVRRIPNKYGYVLLVRYKITFAGAMIEKHIRIRDTEIKAKTRENRIDIIL